MFEHKANHLLNLEIAEERLPEAWRYYNSQLSDLEQKINQNVIGVKRKIDELNLVRKTKQEQAQIEIIKLTARREEAIAKSWIINGRINNR